MPDTQAQTLIEEARAASHPVWVKNRSLDVAALLPRLADALEASEAARRDLTDKIEELAARWERLHDDVPPETVEQDGYDDALHDCAADLRGLVSGGSKERSDG